MGCYKDLSTKALCHRVIQIHESTGLPEFAKLCKIGLCMVVTSVECERSFSTQNRLNDKFQSSLKEENLDLLIAMNMYQVPVGLYDPSNAVLVWLKDKKRRKKRLFQGYKPRAKKVKTSSDE